MLPDGSMVLYSDPYGGRLIWELTYSDLSAVELQAIQEHFEACIGPFHAFTFIDPTDNMLVSSSDLTASVWQRVSTMELTSGVADPQGGSSAFAVTNAGQADQEISQTMIVPASYMYCFSLYASSAEPTNITLIRRATSIQSTSVAIGPSWNRVISSGQLSDTDSNFTIAVSLPAGQRANLYGLQLEPQIAPSRYRPTAQVGGIYANAHWGVNELTVVAQRPNLFSTSFSIETAI